MSRIHIGAALAVAGFFLTATPSFAHVTLEVREAPVGASYKAVLRVPHGCEGQATNTLRVRVPEGFYAVKPMPKPGWTLETKSGPYSGSYDNHGRTVSEGVREIVWSGGELADAHYDEFVFRGTLADTLEPGTVLYFPVVQECANGAERWIEIPEDGGSAREFRKPAPGLKLLPAR